MEISFKGKRAIVTGAGKGIGRETVKALVKCGAEVVALSRTQSDLDSLKAEVPSIQTVCIDVTDIEGIRKVIQDTGPIHLLVNNAAVIKQEDFLETKPESFDAICEVNLKGAFFVAQAVARQMVEGGYPGSIVHISSAGSRKIFPKTAAYSICKAALDQLTRVMAHELGPHKIRVNAVNPTGVKSAMSDDYRENQEEYARFMSGIPLRKLAEQQDIVDAILFLLSDKASMIHGTTLAVDGGQLVA